jgi:hypothetical protein
MVWHAARDDEIRQRVDDIRPYCSRPMLHLRFDLNTESQCHPNRQQPKVGDEKPLTFKESLANLKIAID